MIQDVKYALAFLAGVVYSISWWIIAHRDVSAALPVLPTLVVAFGSVFLVAGAAFSLVVHWDD